MNSNQSDSCNFIYLMIKPFTTIMQTFSLKSILLARIIIIINYFSSQILKIVITEAISDEKNMSEDYELNMITFH